jgi:hypothetical protein
MERAVEAGQIEVIVGVVEEGNVGEAELIGPFLSRDRNRGR